MGGDHAISEDGSLSSEARLALPLSTTSSSQASSRDSSRPTSPELPPSPSPSRAADRLSVEVALSSLKLTPDDPERMFRSLARIIETAEEREESIDFDRLDVDDLGEVLRNADLSERRGYKDVDALRIIRSVLDQMWSNESQLIVEVAKTLADASKDPTWRSPLGEARLLDFFSEIIGVEENPHELRVQSLRLIGNACADTDTNRQRLVSQNRLSPLIEQLQIPDLRKITIPVLYNICADYEPAQRLAAASGLCSIIINLLAGDSISSETVLGYACRLLDFCVPSCDIKRSPNFAVEVLFQTACTPNIDMDDCVSLVDAALLHLKHRTFQQHMISQKLLNLPLSLLAQSYSQQVASQYSLLNSNLILNIGDPSEEELSSMRASLIQALSDVSATPEFTKEYGHMNSPVFGALVKWLLERHVQLQLCSCIMLGNLARSDLMCQTMVSRINIHKPLLNILKDGADTQVLHSTLGFARNLALPAENKIILGNSGVIETISRFWLPDSFPQVSLAATSLIRQLVNGSLSNVQKLLTPLSSDRESPAYAKTYLSILLSLFERSDESAIKLEIARTIAAMLRSLNTPSRGNSHEVANHMARRLYGLHLDVGRPIAMMVSQTQWPIVRSEGWFAMALMARSKEGSAVVEDLVRQVEVFGALEVAMTGQSSLIRESAHSESELEPGQISEMRTKDRENAMVLVSELLKNRGSNMADIRRGVFEDLLQGRVSKLTPKELRNRITIG